MSRSQHLRGSGGASGAGDMGDLRRLFDADDPFMTQPQLRASRRIERRRPCPDWMHDDKKVAAFLQARFPFSQKSMYGLAGRRSIKHERQARIWAKVIQLYFRIGLPASEVAAELCDSNKPVNDEGRALYIRGDGMDLSCTKSYIDRVVQRIRFAAAGRRSDGNLPRRKPKMLP